MAYLRLAISFLCLLFYAGCSSKLMIGDDMASTPKRNELLKVLQENPNARTYLNVIALSEGTAGRGNQDGYDVGFGYRPIEDLSAHPGVTVPFKEKSGRTNYTSAAGRYQFINKTWKGLQDELGLQDFSPVSQDLAALRLIERRGALNDVLAGRFDSATRKLGNEWVSLPSGGAGGTQNKHSWATARNMYKKAASLSGAPIPTTQTAVTSSPNMSGISQAAQGGQPGLAGYGLQRRPEPLFAPVDEAWFQSSITPIQTVERSVPTFDSDRDMTDLVAPAAKASVPDLTRPDAFAMGPAGQIQGPSLQEAALPLGALPIVQNGQRVVAVPETAAEAKEFQKFDPYDEITRGNMVNIFQMLKQAKASQAGERPLFSQHPTMFDEELLQLIDTV